MPRGLICFMMVMSKMIQANRNIHLQADHLMIIGTAARFCRRVLSCRMIIQRAWCPLYRPRIWCCMTAVCGKINGRYVHVLYRVFKNVGSRYICCSRVIMQNDNPSLHRQVGLILHRGLLWQSRRQRIFYTDCSQGIMTIHILQHNVVVGFETALGYSL